MGGSRAIILLLTVISTAFNVGNIIPARRPDTSPRLLSTNIFQLKKRHFRLDKPFTD